MIETKTKKPQIVIVDDDMDFQYVVRQWLEPRYEAVSLSNGEGIVEQLLSLEPDLLILDVQMPGPDGFRVCRNIRSQFEFADLPIIFLTGLKSNEDFLRNLEVGGTIYLTKPIGRNQLLARIRELL